MTINYCRRGTKIAEQMGTEGVVFYTKTIKSPVSRGHLLTPPLT